MCVVTTHGRIFKYVIKYVIFKYVCMCVNVCVKKGVLRSSVISREWSSSVAVAVLEARQVKHRLTLNLDNDYNILLYC